METDSQTATIIFAAGRGSRMEGYGGNKTLLPMIPEKTIFHGSLPLLEYILKRLPQGPKAVVINHCGADIQTALAGLNVAFYHQPVLNGTGGALLSAGDFVTETPAQSVLITMGDVPLVAPATYCAMVDMLQYHDMVILGFSSADKKKYGLIEMDTKRVRRIIEWKDWKDFSADRQSRLSICNAGIYAVRRDRLEAYLSRLGLYPQTVCKVIDGKKVLFEEFFITDMVEMMCRDDLQVGVHMATGDLETIGVDDPEALQKVQAAYAMELNRKKQVKISDP